MSGEHSFELLCIAAHGGVLTATSWVERSG